MKKGGSLIRLLITIITIFMMINEKYGPEKTPYLDTFQAVYRWPIVTFFKAFLNRIIKQVKLNPYMFALILLLLCFIYVYKIQNL